MEFFSRNGALTFKDQRFFLKGAGCPDPTAGSRVLIQTLACHEVFVSPSAQAVRGLGVKQILNARMVCGPTALSGSWTFLSTTASTQSGFR